MLNQPLYDRLIDVFDKVRVSNHGIKARVSHVPDWQRPGRLLDGVSSTAEHYTVNCPFCSDSRHRLAIHYLYGVRDRKSGSRRIGLAHCHNEDCLADPKKREKLFRMLDLSLAFDGTTPKVTKREQRQERITAPRIPLPKNKVPITSPEADDEAIAYLQERGFVLQELWDLWRVYYCERCTTTKPAIRDRIVYPIYSSPLRYEGDEPRVRTAGWQARRIDDDGSTQKYLFPTGFQKSHFLYGATWAAQHEGPLVICEGATDVWRLRTNAVALFGKTMSHQQKLAAQDLGTSTRDIVIFLDRDAKLEAERLAKAIWNDVYHLDSPPRVEIAAVPRKRKDPADCSREEAWNCVAKALGKSLRRLRVSLDSNPPAHPKDTCS